MVLIPVRLAKKLLDDAWASQFETRNAAENTVCAYDRSEVVPELCGDRYEDFEAHHQSCPFLAYWEELAEIRKACGDTREPKKRTS
jgi:hypothetical protein